MFSALEEKHTLRGILYRVIKTRHSRHFDDFVKEKNYKGKMRKNPPYQHQIIL
jgi:hypothetical protein